jgi:iron uptake system component EfeO
VASDDNAAARKAIAAYKAYVIGQAALLGPRTTAFTDAVRAGNIAEAKKQFPISREPYERIEPVAESFGNLDPEIDARAGDVPAAGWSGFHKLEKMLWVDNASAAEMKPFADKLDTDVAKLIALVQTTDYQTAQIANGAKSLMDEIGASKVTGEEDRYSHTDLYDFKANVDGAKAVFKSMHPILQKRAPTLAATITNAFADMDYGMEPFRRGPGWVTYTKVDAVDRRGLSRSVDALALPLSNMAAIVAQ